MEITACLRSSGILIIRSDQDTNLSPVFSKELAGFGANGNRGRRSLVGDSGSCGKPQGVASSFMANTWAILQTLNDDWHRIVPLVRHGLAAASSTDNLGERWHMGGPRHAFRRLSWIKGTLNITTEGEWVSPPWSKRERFYDLLSLPASMLEST
uniref:Uncharacterized protein n=1 Tax=Sphaerodactylus townsendi TaxID=933632 RepID=A0ACB8FKT3_9SAUR